MQPITPLLDAWRHEPRKHTLTGASWYALNTAANGLPDANLQVLVTADHDRLISGQINFQVFPLGVGADQQ